MASPALSDGSYEPEVDPEGSSFSDDVLGSASEIKPKQKRVAAGKKPTAAKAPALPKLLKAFDNEQLIQLILKMVAEKPELQARVLENLPKPDLAKKLKRLDQLERNIWRAMPNTRFGSGRDAFCYRRCSVHVGALKKAILEEGKNLVTSAAWPTVLEYVLSAAQNAASAPTWDDSSKNNQKSLTFKALDGYMKQAATKGKAVLDQEACTEAIEKLKGYGEHFNGSIEALAKLA
ncbi:hypothetical protein KFL_000240510 [Klebsormidium nitens]|uniref:Uncharacterized protein n=1 Tax=Klebsormidium nitens TaxID=105231 RepID=A0A1Y1HPI6_KLENI|nr:hypothetical protein KFL_000240510 [Klebsormidium nitens]|eukprot:GAQ79119.1 hypothetical protein KFL_000240510 [Klebsormidium nitens]